MCACSQVWFGGLVEASARPAASRTSMNCTARHMPAESSCSTAPAQLLNCSIGTLQNRRIPFPSLSLISGGPCCTLRPLPKTPSSPPPPKSCNFCPFVFQGRKHSTGTPPSHSPTTHGLVREARTRPAMRIHLISIATQTLVTNEATPISIFMRLWTPRRESQRVLTWLSRFPVQSLLRSSYHPYNT